MDKLAIKALLSASKDEQQQALGELNQMLEALSAQERIVWALDHLPDQAIVSSSFGIQSAVMLDLLSKASPDIPVVLTDTGYLFPQTYQFIDELSEKLSLNLKVYRSATSSAWQEARYGKLWEQGLDALERYNRINKVEPMQRALKELNAGTWFAGLRREQAKSRKQLDVLAIHGDCFKALPIIDWSNKDIHQYLTDNALPYHPLWYENYVSVGDKHSSKPLEIGMLEEDTRFNGVKRECGLHYEI